MKHRRGLIALALALLTVCFIPARAVMHVALSDDYHNAYILAIPFLSALVICTNRKEVFQLCTFCPRAGVPIALLGIALSGCVRTLPALQTKTYWLSVSIFSVILIGAGGFLICFGAHAFRRARFALVFLLLAIPAPPRVMTLMISGLQNGSAAFSAILFRLLHVPALRQGLTFSLPGLDIEILQPCSGIRSVLGLSIGSIVAGHLFIRSWWKQLFLVAVTIPIAMFKNAVRIVAISTLAVYVDPGFLHGGLHTWGGLPVNLLELAILTPIVVGLHRSDTRRFLRPNHPAPRIDKLKGSANRADRFARLTE